VIQERLKREYGLVRRRGKCCMAQLGKPDSRQDASSSRMRILANRAAGLLGFTLSSVVMSVVCGPFNVAPQVRAAEVTAASRAIPSQTAIANARMGLTWDPSAQVLSIQLESYGAWAIIFAADFPAPSCGPPGLPRSDCPPKGTEIEVDATTGKIAEMYSAGLQHYPDLNGVVRVVIAMQAVQKTFLPLGIHAYILQAVLVRVASYGRTTKLVWKLRASSKPLPAQDATQANLLATVDAKTGRVLSSVEKGHTRTARPFTGIRQTSHLGLKAVRV
jgi:hypothetical protein